LSLVHGKRKDNRLAFISLTTDEEEQEKGDYDPPPVF